MSSAEVLLAYAEFVGKSRRAVRLLPGPARSLALRYIALPHMVLRVTGGVGFAPSLELVPGTFAQAWQRLRFRRFGKLHGRESRRAQQRIHQSAILRAQALTFCALARDFFLEQPDVIRLQESIEPIQQAPPVAQDSSCAFFGICFADTHFRNHAGTD